MSIAGRLDKPDTVVSLKKLKTWSSGYKELKTWLSG